MNDGGPLTYSDSDLTFHAFSQDNTLIGKLIDYGVNVSFKDYPRGADYPNVSIATNGAEVLFNEPCLNPFTFATVD